MKQIPGPGDTKACPACGLLKCICGEPEANPDCPKCKGAGAYLEADPRPDEDDPMPQRCELCFPEYSEKEEREAREEDAWDDRPDRGK